MSRERRRGSEPGNAPKQQVQLPKEKKQGRECEDCLKQAGFQNRKRAGEARDSKHQSDAPLVAGTSGREMRQAHRRDAMREKNGNTTRDSEKGDQNKLSLSLADDKALATQWNAVQ